MKKNYLFYSIIIIALFILAYWLYADMQKANPSIKDQIDAIVSQEADLSDSTLPDADERLVLDQLSDIRQQLSAKEIYTNEELLELAQKYRLLRDYDHLFAVYDVLDQMGVADKGYLVTKGELLLELKQWENARKNFEELKATWPIHETYLGLAEAYKNIEGTPNYVIDAIYEESLRVNLRGFPVLQAYAEWLEQTGRPQQALVFYEEMYKKAPQEAIQNKINELKQI